MIPGGRSNGADDTLSKPVEYSGRFLGRPGQTLVLALKDFAEDSGPQWAASIAYYALFSVLPLLLALVAIAASFVELDMVVELITEAAGEALPMGEDELATIVEGAFEARAAAGLFSLLGLLWSGTRVFSVLTLALNIFYDSEEQYGFFKRLGIEALMAVTVGLLLVLAFSGRYIIQLLHATISIFPEAEGLLYSAATNLLPMLILFAAYTLMYRWVPRRRPAWWPAAIGAALATVLVVVGQPVFAYYVTVFGDFELLYGSVAIIVILVLWAYFVGLFTLFGGELTSHIQALYVEGLSPAEIERRHIARSPKRAKGQAEPAAGDDERAAGR